MMLVEDESVDVTPLEDEEQHHMEHTEAPLYTSVAEILSRAM